MMISCTDDLSNEQWKNSEGERVKLTFKVNIPEVTSATSRSFDEPSVETLHLIVFDNNGYFVEKQQANKNKTIVSDTEVTEFSVTLTASASQRTIHFIGNYDGADNLPFGSESDIIGGLKHSKGDDAYWQRMTLGGINEKTNIGTVPLIRNHAKVTVEVAESVTNFELESFTVVNIVTEGYLAPYNMNNGSFAQFLETGTDGTFTQTNGKFACLSYKEITIGSDGYEGYVPGTAELNLNTDIDDEDDWIAANEAFYLYERRFESTNHTFVLVKGKFTNANGQQPSSYYKVDLVYQDNNNVTQYYNLLRNFNYKIIINSVTGNGKDSAEKAYDMTGSHNNLAASIETQSLTNISDGASQLYVSYTEEYIVSDEPVTLQYMYIPNISNKDAASNESVSIVCTENGDVVKSYSVASSNDLDEEGEDTGWRTITINPQTPDANEAKKQTLTLTAGNLSRTITYILRTPYIMDMQCYDGNGTNRTDKVVDADISEKVNIDITLPTGLPESLFPLTFYIEAEKRTLYPDATANQIPVETEIPSIFNGGATFGYTKEVTWEDYYVNNAYNTLFVSYLLTNTETNASRVRVYNKYFSVAEDYFTNSGTTYYTLPIVVSNNGTNLPTNDNTIITIYYTNGTIMGNTTWGELKAGTAAVLTTVDTTNQNSSFGYFAYTKDGKVYKTGNMNIEQLDNTLNFN